MFELPDDLKLTTDEYLAQFQNDVSVLSKGRLTDFSSSSILRVIAEYQALTLQDVYKNQEQSLPFLASQLVESLGFSRSKGTKAQVSVRFVLENVFDSDFIILRGTRFGLSVGDVAIFETNNDLIIPKNVDTTDPTNYPLCRIDASSIDVGTLGNQPIQQALIIQTIPGIDSVWIDEPSQGGTDLEQPEAYFDRISGVIAKFLENQFSLVQSSEFEQATKELLGLGSTAIAVPDLAADGSTKQVASMLIFALNADGTSLNSAQIRNLSESIAPRSPLVQGRLYFNSLNLPLINISLSVKAPSNINSTSLAADINSRLRLRFTLEFTSQQQSIELYEIIHIAKLAGALEPIATIGFVGDTQQARNLPLPRVAPGTDRTTPGKINIIKVTLEPSGTTITYAN
ncbi:baseplate J/gp47 family protein [Chroococcidiopsis sp.]|uniref:baseplate J/gp47 family protein n=1 Tax=Chroococcidiopsis sp. TaxID=3088168 RepID=UPI003F3C48FD